MYEHLEVLIHYMVVVNRYNNISEKKYAREKKNIIREVESVNVINNGRKFKE